MRERGGIEDGESPRYSDYRRARDEYLSRRGTGVPGAFRWETEDAEGGPLLRHTPLREPHSLLRIPRQFRSRGVGTRQLRKNGSSRVRMRFVVAVDECARNLPMSLQAGVDETTVQVASLSSASAIHVLDLPLVEPGQRGWIGLRWDEDASETEAQAAQVLILSFDSERL